jgi:predicted RNA-binding protein with TRAM domain
MWPHWTVLFIRVSRQLTESRNSTSSSNPLYRAKDLTMESVMELLMAPEETFDYESLLDRAKKELPQTLEAHDRFQVPEPEVMIEGKTTVIRNFVATKIEKDGRIQILTCETCGAHRPVHVRKQTKPEAVKEIEAGNTYDLMIVDVGKKGDGIARKGNFVIYVPGTAKGTRVKVKIDKVSGTVAFGIRVS